VNISWYVFKVQYLQCSNVKMLYIAYWQTVLKFTLMKWTFSKLQWNAQHYMARSWRFAVFQCCYMRGLCTSKFLINSSSGYYAKIHSLGFDRRCETCYAYLVFVLLCPRFWISVQWMLDLHSKWSMLHGNKLSISSLHLITCALCPAV